MVFTMVIRSVAGPRNRYRAPAFEGIGSDLIGEAALAALSDSWDAIQAQRYPGRKRQMLAGESANGSSGHTPERPRNTPYLMRP
jgi:hypothetical protein